MKVLCVITVFFFPNNSFESHDALCKNIDLKSAIKSSIAKYLKKKKNALKEEKSAKFLKSYK